MKRFFKILLWTFLILFVLVNLISATNAYKFTHFYNPGEVVIKPENKKTTWDHVSDILFGKDYIKKKNVPLPESFSNVILTTKDNIKLAGWYSAASNALVPLPCFMDMVITKLMCLKKRKPF